MQRAPRAGRWAHEPADCSRAPEVLLERIVHFPQRERGSLRVCCSSVFTTGGSTCVPFKKTARERAQSRCRGWKQRRRRGPLFQMERDGAILDDVDAACLFSVERRLECGAGGADGCSRRGVRGGRAKIALSFGKARQKLQSPTAATRHQTWPAVPPASGRRRGSQRPVWRTMHGRDRFVRAPHGTSNLHSSLSSARGVSLPACSRQQKPCPAPPISSTSSARSR